MRPCAHIPVRSVPEQIALECEHMAASRVTLNGFELNRQRTGTLDASFLRADIAKYIRTGENELIFEIDYYQPEQVYYIFNGAYYEPDSGVTESLYNCLSYVTDLEAVYLRGDFAVRTGKLNPDTKQTLCTDEGFAIDLPVKDVNLAQMIPSGYPFFGGEMSYSLTFDATGHETVLRLDGRYSIACVRINGHEPHTMLFEQSCNIEGETVAGTNRLEITLTNNLRNTLGPFHTVDPEPFAVGPGTFTRYGSWNNGKSENYVDRYSFVFYGLHNIQIG